MLLVAAAAALAGMATPHDAQALSPSSPWQSIMTQGTSSSYWSKLRSLLRGTGNTSTAYESLMGGESATTQKGVANMLYRARVGARFLPSVGLVATRLTLVGTSAYIAWRVYQHFSDGGDPVAVDLWLDSASLGADALVNGLAVPATFPDGGASGSRGSVYWWWSAYWGKVTGQQCVSSVGTLDCFTVYLFPAYFWDGSCITTGWCNGTLAIESQAGLEGGGSPASFALDVDDCAFGWGCVGAHDWGREMGLLWMMTRTLQHLGDGRVIAGATSKLVTDTVVVEGHTVRRYRIFIPDYAFDWHTSIGDVGPITGTPEVTTEYDVPANAGQGAADVPKVVEAFDTPCGRALINHLLEPSWYPWVPGCIETAPEAEPEAQTLTLLRPLSTETYTDYIARLQDAGWVGTATLVELDPFDASIGPDAVSKIGITGSSGTWRRSLWPPTWPKVAIDAPLTIYHNPETAPPVQPDPTDEEAPPGGGDVFDSGGCEPWLEATPNFAPLMGLDFVDAFPFALFGWVAGFLGQFDVSPVAPSWDFHIVIPATAVSGPVDVGHLGVDLDWASGYMNTVRTILAFVLWAGAVWYFATALLGIRAPGNPAEAVDEA